jgi:Holliday junction resolvase RusA-like endonuclease
MTQPTDLERAIGLVMAAGGLPHQVLSFMVDGEPIAKARVRTTKGRQYSRGRTADAELDIAHQIQRFSAPPWFPGNVAVAVVFYRSNRHRIDVDNLLKTVLDGITKSQRIWADDDQVTALLGIVEYDEDRPRIAVAVAHHDSTMLRGDERLTHICESCGTKYRPHSQRELSRYCSRACRSTRVLVCVDCGGPTSASHVNRCQPCHLAWVADRRRLVPGGVS